MSMEFSRQEYWSRSPFPTPGDHPDPGIEHRSPALQADCLVSEPPGKWSFQARVLEWGAIAFSISKIYTHTHTHIYIFVYIHVSLKASTFLSARNECLFMLKLGSQKGCSFIPCSLRPYWKTGHCSHTRESSREMEKGLLIYLLF